MLHGFRAATVACYRVKRNSVPSTHIRFMITTNRRAKATIAFLIPRCLAICIPQALSQDHFFDRSGGSIILPPGGALTAAQPARAPARPAARRQTADATTTAPALL